MQIMHTKKTARHAGGMGRRCSRDLTSGAWAPRDGDPAGDPCGARPAGRACRPGRRQRHTGRRGNFQRT